MSVIYPIALKELIITQKGKKPIITDSKKGSRGIPYLDISALEAGYVKEYTFEELASVCSENDVLVVWDGSRSGLVFKGQRGAIGSTIMGISPIGLTVEYLYYFLKSKYRIINNNLIGTGIPHVDTNIFYELQIPFTTIDQQEKIISQLLIELNESNRFIQKQKEVILQTLSSDKISIDQNADILETIKVFKESVFNKGILGDLTKNWRKNNFKSKDSWEKVSLGSISKLVTSGSRDWSKYYSNQGARFIRGQDIKENYIDINNLLYLDLPINVEGKRALVENGDILITITGSNIGKCAIVEKSFKEEAYVNQNIALVKLKNKVQAKYLYFFFLSPQGQKLLKSKMSGDAQPALNLTDIKSTEVLIPPLDEQNQIVHEINELIEISNKVEGSYRRTLTEAENLQISIIEHTFKVNGSEPPILDKELEECLKNVKIEKNKFEQERKASNKKKMELRSKLKETTVKNKEIIDIISENNSLDIQEVWKESKYYATKDVESFYEDLSKLNADKLITVSFNDVNKIISTITLQR